MNNTKEQSWYYCGFFSSIYYAIEEKGPKTSNFSKMPQFRIVPIKRYSKTRAKSAHLETKMNTPLNIIIPKNV